jgi:hypothetical protein
MWRAFANRIAGYPLMLAEDWIAGYPLMLAEDM